MLVLAVRVECDKFINKQFFQNGNFPLVLFVGGATDRSRSFLEESAKVNDQIRYMFIFYVTSFCSA